MPVRSRAAFLVALLLLSGAGLGTALADTAAQSSPTENTTTNSTIRLDIGPDGDTRWTVTLTTTFANGSDGSNWTAVAEAYEDGETSLLPTQPYEQASDEVGTAVGREMEITQVSRSTERTNETGSLVLSFTWSKFGYTDGDRLYVDDVFNGTTGRWFPSLSASQTLVVTGPDGYDIFSAPGATVQNQTLRWEGPVVFGPDTPTIVYVQSGVAGPSTTPGGPLGSSGMVVPVLIIVLGGTLAVIAYVATRSDGPLLPADDDAVGTTPAATPPGDDGDDDPETGAPATEPDDPDEEDPADDEEVDEELLSDEERVERLIEQNGGRMKQANIVTETGWSNAKVSQLLSAMADEGRIEKLRIGRENLISFPDDEDDDTDA